MPRNTKHAGKVVVVGGVLGEALDRCYHQACDTLSNIGETGLDQLSDGAAYTAAVYAFDKQAPGKDKSTPATTLFRGPNRQR